jgi:RNA polymerase sigma-70 factor (ECF subfamily)
MDADEALYARVREGDMTAFDALYERYASRLYGFLVAELGNGADAEEVFHEAFMATLKADGLSFDVARGGGFRAYLYRAAKNRAHNRRRGAMRGQKLVNEAAMSTPEPPRRPDDALADEERAQALDRAVLGLPVALREVYRLRTSGLSYEEMAVVLEIPLGTLKSRMHHLVSVLREELRPWTAP